MAQGANGVCGGWVKQLLEAIPVVLLVAAIGLCEGRTDLGGQNKLRGRRPGWERQGSFLYIPRWRYPIHNTYIYILYIIIHIYIYIHILIAFTFSSIKTKTTVRSHGCSALARSLRAEPHAVPRHRDGFAWVEAQR